jgi:hypothetical protein
VSRNSLLTALSWQGSSLDIRKDILGDILDPYACRIDLSIMELLHTRYVNERLGMQTNQRNGIII